MNATAPQAVTHADIKTIAAALSVSRQAATDRAKNEGWPFKEIPAPGRPKRLYPLSILPEAIRLSVAAHLISSPGTALISAVPASPVGGATGTSSLVPMVANAAGGSFYPTVLSDDDKTQAQRDGERARKLVLAALSRLQESASCSREAAMTTLLTNARAGKLEPGLDALLHQAKDKRGRKGDAYPSIRSLKRWLSAPDLTPKRRRKDMSVLEWHAPAIALRKRPQGSSFTWIHDQLTGQGFGVSYDQVRRFFVEKFSTLDQLKGRHTGSQLRSHKFYQHRTSEGLAPADEVHADGWNSHFTAPHPVTGEFVTYEVWHFHDVATRYVTPPGIDLTEKFEVIAKGLENYIRVFGVPLLVMTDSTKVVKGSARFTKDPVRSLEERIGCTIVHPKEVGSSQTNGICENFNTSWLDKRARELATYQNPKQMDELTFKRVKKLTADMVKAAHSGDLAERDAKKREIQRMGKGMVFDSAEEAVAWINRIHDEYNNRPHRSLKKIADPLTGKKRHQKPSEALAEHIGNGWEPVTLTEHELVDIFRPHVVVKVTRETVSPYGGMRYRNEDVLGHWNGKQVVVAYDIHDWRTVWVKDMKGELICEADFVAATGYHAQSAYDAAEEKRAKAQIRLRERQIKAIEARYPRAAIEQEPVKTIVDFIDLNADQVKEEPEKSLLDFLPDAPEQEEKTMSYSDTVMWLYGDKDQETPENEAAAR